VKHIYWLALTLGALALAILFVEPLRGAAAGAGDRAPQATAVSQQPLVEAAPVTADLSLVVAPTHPAEVAALVREHEELRALLATTVAPAHHAEIAALVAQRGE
jgi:hypothetical protein